MKVLSCRFYKCLRPFNMLTVKECSETVFFLESKLTKFFTACKFRNKVAMTMIFFSKSLKFCGDSRNRLKKMKTSLVLKIITFESGTTNSQNREQDTSHWQSNCYETPPSQVLSEWLKIWWKCLHADFSRIWDSLKYWQSKGVLKTFFLESGLTKSFTDCNFRNKAAMTIIIFSKMFKIWCRFQKWIKEIRKSFWF